MEKPTEGVETPVLTLTEEAHRAVTAISRPRSATHRPGLRICRRPDRPAFSVRRAVLPNPDDEVVEHDGARVFLEPVAALKFHDSLLDVRTDHDGRVQFVVRDAA